MLSCLCAKVKRYQKDSFILMAGDKVKSLGIVLSGSAHIIKENMDGDRTIIATLEAGDYFAEALCCAEIGESPVSVLASSDARVMLLDFSHVLHTCPNSCLFHTKLIENMLSVLASKNLFLQNRIEVVSQKTLRLKVMQYLESLAVQQGAEITLPLNREELADFLCADRSALSHELSRMKQDGLIEYHKNHFRLL